MDIVALVVGATGIAGTRRFAGTRRTGASVYGLSRQPGRVVTGVTHVAADLIDRERQKSREQG